MFMGDEWGSKQPFPFFCDFKGDLANAVRQAGGRNFPKLTPRTTPKFRIRSRYRLSNLQRSTGASSLMESITRGSTWCAVCSRPVGSSIMPLLLEFEPGACEASMSGGLLDAYWRMNRWTPVALDGESSPNSLRHCRAFKVTRRFGETWQPTSLHGRSLWFWKAAIMATTLPLSTYRLQLSSEFGFDDAAKLVPYLKALGITHLYSSPFLKARKGSKHGYDIVDHGALNPEFGGEAGFLRLSDALRDAGLGLILDFVPNHMGIGYADNSWWLDVLEWGQQSPHARAFDIAWELLPYRRGGGVLLPVLGRPYGEALQNGEIALKYDAQEGTFSAWYFDHRFPISPQRYGEILKSVIAMADAGTNERAERALIELAAAHAHPRAPSYAQAANYKKQLATIEGGAALIERGLAAYDATTEGGRQALHRLLERQHYRLAYWRVSVSGINYRRFFDINDLAGVRVEDPQRFPFNPCLGRAVDLRGSAAGLTARPH